MRAPAPSCVLLALLVTLPGLAGPDDDSQDELIEKVREYDARKKTSAVGLLGARLSYPEYLSGTIGVLWARHPVDFDCTTGCDHRGLMLEVDPGIAGAQVGVGYGILVGDKGLNKFFIRRVYVGWGGMVKYLRTWGNDSLEPKHQSFLGAEGKFTFTQINVRLGVFRSMAGSDASDRWLVTGGLGWGF